MSTSSLIVLRDLTTGAGRTGLSVKLRRKDDSFASDYATASEIAGKPGVYEFIDIPVNQYKLWINGSEDKSFGGTHGKWWPTDSLLGYLAASLYLSADNINSGTLADARIPGLDASKIVAGYLMQNRIPYAIDALKIGTGIVGNPNFDKLTGLRELLQQKLDKMPALNSNSFIVDPDAFTGAGSMKFNSIQSAINYAHSLTPAPSNSNRYYIYIMPNKSEAGYAENIILQPFVHLIGFGMPVIAGTITGGIPSVIIQNCKLTYPGSSLYSSLNLYNCLLNITNDDTSYELSLQNNVLLNCGIINTSVAAEFNNKITSLGGNKFYGKCWSNLQLNLHSTDKGAVDFVDDLSFDFIL